MRSDSVWYTQMNPAIYIQTPLWRVTRFHAVVQIYPDIFIRAYMHGDRSSDRTKSASGEEDWGVYCMCACVSVCYYCFWEGNSDAVEREGKR